MGFRKKGERSSIYVLVNGKAIKLEEVKDRKELETQYGQNSPILSEYDLLKQEEQLILEEEPNFPEIPEAYILPVGEPIPLSSILPSLEATKRKNGLKELKTSKLEKVTPSTNKRQQASKKKTKKTVTE